MILPQTLQISLKNIAQGIGLPLRRRLYSEIR